VVDQVVVGGGPPFGWIPPASTGQGPGMSFGLSGVPVQNPATGPTFHTQQKLTPKVEIVKLNDTNWVIWTRQVYAMLWEMGVNYCVHDAYEGTYDDLKAQTIITQACTDHYSVQITHLKCAFHMWNTLLQTFNLKAAAKLMSLHIESRLFTMKSGEKPSDYVLRARRISNSLRSLGDAMSEINLCSMMLEGLTHEYEVDKRLQLSVCNHNPDVHQLQHVLEPTF
jgi:hypothetical protein